MRLKLDENLSKTHAEFLQKAGYDCARVTDEGLSGAADDAVWQRVWSKLVGYRLRLTRRHGDTGTRGKQELTASPRLPSPRLFLSTPTTFERTLWQQVCREKRFFITLDLDFSDIRKFAPGTHPGILLLRPSSRGRQAVLALLTKVVNQYLLEDLRGCFVVVDERQTRIRRPMA